MKNILKILLDVGIVIFAVIALGGAAMMFYIFPSFYREAIIGNPGCTFLCGLGILTFLYYTGATAIGVIVAFILYKVRKKRE